MNEGDLSKKIVKKLNEGHHTFCWKVAQTGGPDTKRGISDIIGLHRGIFFAIEVKLPANKKGVTPIQKHFLTQVNTSLGFGREARTVDEALEVIREIDEALDEY